MPYGPKGQWRPADPVAAGVHIGKLMVGEAKEIYVLPKARQQSEAAVALALGMTEVDRTKRAKTAAKARWSKKR